MHARRGLVFAFLVVAAPAHAQIRSTAPPLPPADAVAVLQSSHSPANVTGLHFYRDIEGPMVVFGGASGPSAGPWDWPGESPRLRLDGTPLSRPPDRYGPDYVFGFGSGFGAGFSGGRHQIGGPSSVSGGQRHARPR
jgi:hypothetical protein